MSFYNELNSAINTKGQRRVDIVSQFRMTANTKSYIDPANLCQGKAKSGSNRLNGLHYST